MVHGARTHGLDVPKVVDTSWSRPRKLEYFYKLDPVCLLALGVATRLRVRGFVPYFRESTSGNMMYID